MADVWTMPPLAILAYESSITDPSSGSVSASGAAQLSQTQPNRAVYNITASGIGRDGQSSGRVDVLKRLFAAKMPLVQVDTLSSVWWGKSRNQDTIVQNPVAWTSGGDPMSWTVGGDDVIWYEKTPIRATTGNDGAFDYVTVTGIPDGAQINAGDPVQGGGQVGYVINNAVSTGGALRLYLTAPIPTGDVSIGEKVTRVFRFIDRPVIRQSVGSFTFDAQLVEAFEADYPDGLNIIETPWVYAQ